MSVSSMLRDLVNCLNFPIRLLFFLISGVAAVADSLRVESVESLEESTS